MEDRERAVMALRRLYQGKSLSWAWKRCVIILLVVVPVIVPVLAVQGQMPATRQDHTPHPRPSRIALWDDVPSVAESESESRPEPVPTPAVKRTPVAAWPWGLKTPTWNDAQQYPQYYASWLQRQYPEYQISRHRALVTAYTPHAASCAPYDDGRTALMNNAWRFGVAVATSWLREWRRRGIRVHVPGYLSSSYPGVAWSPDDCGAALERSRRRGIVHIDVRYLNERAALRHWGSRLGFIWLVCPRRKDD